MSDRIFFGAGVGGRLRTLAQDARHLEALGYDFLFTGEHVMQGNPPRPSAMAIPTLGVAAGATERVLLVASVLLLPLYHPVLLAKMLAVLDRASGGRLVAGIGVGGEIPAEFQAVGVPVKERGARANEALEIMRRLWTQEHVTHQGRFHQFQDVTLNAPPLQKPHPPIWVAGRREAAMRRAVQYGDGWYPYLYSPEQLRDSMQRIRAMAAQAGRDLSGFRCGIMVFAALAESRDQALDVAASALGSRYQYGGDWRQAVERFCLLGTPADCARRLRDYVDAGATYVAVQPLGEQAGEHVEVVASQVIPHFR